MKHLKLFLITGLLAAILVGCQTPESPRGFSLPNGDVAAGNQAFLELGCHGCHTVRGIDLPAPDFPPAKQIELGGESTLVKTYGELVTAVINPSHRFVRGYPIEEISVDGTSLMPNLNSRLTVQQLVDLVAFLQPQYKVVTPHYEYMPYG